MKKKVKKKMGRPTRFSLNAVIEKNVDGNPRRVGTKAHANFSFIKNGIKVSTYIKNGGTMKELRYAADKHWVCVSET